MYDKFKYERVALSLIRLDDRNPRIFTQHKLKTENEIISYLFDNDDLIALMKKIAVEGRNPGAERPYVVKDGKSYIVIEGNTRIATYKLLTGQIIAEDQHKAHVPLVPQTVRDELASVDVAIAPSRDSLMTIMARAHFGRGDKSRWGYLGSRKTVTEEYKSGKSISSLANTFGRSQSQIKDLIIEYLLYAESLNFEWTPAEKDALQQPSLEFNPPVRFLQTTGHRKMVGVELDKTNLTVKFDDNTAKIKFKHLVKRTVIDSNGPSATASYEEVFADFVMPIEEKNIHLDQANKKSVNDETTVSDTDADPEAKSQDFSSNKDAKDLNDTSLKPHTLFNYAVTKNDLTLKQLMKEAKGLNTKNYPASGSALLRSIVEVILKLIIEKKALNQSGKLLDLEGSLGLIIGQAKLSADDTKILKEFKSSHLSYLNLSSHATVTPNHSRLMMARDCINAFVKRNI